MGEDLFINASSNDFLELFPDNTQNNFRIKLPLTLLPSLDYHVALLEITYPQISDLKQNFIVHSDITTSMLTPNGGYTALRYIFPHYSSIINEVNHFEVAFPYYLKVSQRVQDSIHIWITTKQGVLYNFAKSEPINIVLHFKK